MADNSHNLIWMVFGVLLGGLSIIWLGQVLMGARGPAYIDYALLIWAWIRSVDAMNRRLLPWIADENVRFSVSWLLPIVAIVLMGLSHLSAPVIFLAVVGLTDLIIRFVVDIQRQWWGTIKSVVSGFVIAILMGAITIGAHYPWLDALSPAGIGYVDDFRDAATVMAWHNYSVISHGVHGLLFEAYHSLSAMFASPFIAEGFGVFSVFIFLSLIAAPALIVYGISMVIMQAPAATISQNWLFVLVIYLFSISCFNYVFTQRSLMISTLLMVGVVPLLARLAFRTVETSRLSNLILALLLPLVLFARAFNGIVLAAVVVPLMLFRSSAPKYILMLGLIAAAAVVVLFFGATARAETSYFKGLVMLLTTNLPWFVNGWVILLLPVLIFLKERKTSPETTIWILVRDPYYGPIIYICTVTFFFCMRTLESDDAFYQTVPAFMLLFFALILAPVQMISKHFPLGGLTDGLRSKGIIYCVGFILLSTNYLANMNWHAIKEERRFIRLLVEQSLEQRVALSNSGTCDAGLARWACDVRIKQFGAHNIIEISKVSLPARLATSAQLHAQTVDGVTAVYVAPEHPYWQMKHPSPSLASLYSMSVAGLPLVFGAPKDNKNPAYSIMTAHQAEGTLLPLLDIGGVEGLCQAALKVGVDNVVIFETVDEAGTFVMCAEDSKRFGQQDLGS